MLTPKSVIDVRQRYLSAWAAQFKAIHGNDIELRLRDDAETALYPNAFDGLLRIAYRADIVIWDEGVHTASKHGHEIFNTSWPESLKPADHLWCLANSDFVMQPEVHPFESAAAFTLVRSTEKELCVVHFGFDTEGKPVLRPTTMRPTKPARPGNSGWLAARSFLDARVGYQSEHRLDSNAEKHWHRQNVHIPTITTITLRRTEVTPIDTTAYHLRNWTHRWSVAPHWALRACGRGRSDRKTVFIHGYIKGPEDMPFVEKTRIYRASR